MKNEPEGPVCACGKVDLYETWLALQTAQNENAGSSASAVARQDMHDEDKTGNEMKTNPLISHPSPALLTPDA